MVITGIYFANAPMQVNIFQILPTRLFPAWLGNPSPNPFLVILAELEFADLAGKGLFVFSGRVHRAVPLPDAHNLPNGQWP
jgi:hypothetical protein